MTMKPETHYLYNYAGNCHCPASYEGEPMERPAMHIIVDRGRNLSTPSSVRNARIMQVSNLGKAFRLVGRPGSLIWPPVIGALTWSYPAQVESKHPHPLMPPGKRAGKQHEKLKRLQPCLLLNTPTSHHADFHLRIWSYIQWAVEWLPVLLWEFYIFIGYSCSWNWLVLRSSIILIIVIWLQVLIGKRVISMPRHTPESLCRKQASHPAGYGILKTISAHLILLVSLLPCLFHLIWPLPEPLLRRKGGSVDDEYMTSYGNSQILSPYIRVILSLVHHGYLSLVFIPYLTENHSVSDAGRLSSPLKWIVVDRFRQPSFKFIQSIHWANWKEASSFELWVSNNHPKSQDTARSFYMIITSTASCFFSWAFDTP